jgi:ERF superfamily
MNIREKIQSIQQIARKVPKNGVNQEQGWSYMRIEDVVSIATRLMARHRLFLTPSLRSSQRTMNERGGGSIVDVVITWTLDDLESGEQFHFDVPGSGWDYNSKATSKALTDSRKYAMILLFNLKAGDDPEERGAIARDAAKDRQQEIAQKKIADAQAGKGVNGSVPSLVYTWDDDTQTGTVSGDKELLSSAAKLFRDYKFPKSATQWLVNAEQMENIKRVLEERGIPLSKLFA